MRTKGVWIECLRALPPGVWVIVAVFVASAALRTLVGGETHERVVMWLFSPEHHELYEETVARRGLDERDIPLEFSLLSIEALKNRMLNGIYGGLPSADMIEVERAVAGPVFAAPEGAIGFRDLTPVLERDGLGGVFNEPSLSPWSRGGRVYGLPHDVHPVMLAYRADILEPLGIDLSRAETWRAFFGMLRPLMEDLDGDGRPDHYPLAFWYTQKHNLELLLLQGGGSLFDPSGGATIDSARNAEILARIVSWCVGPDRRVVDIDEFSAAGHRARIRGEAIAYLCPDWMCSIWKTHAPELGGKLKLMPLPAFEPGGRRTSVRGGTMLGFPTSSDRFGRAWEDAKTLYTSRALARRMYERIDIITPVKSLWNDPVFDEPDPFFMGQPKGRMYIELAPSVPERTSSPYYDAAVRALRDAAVGLAEWGRENGRSTPEGLVARAALELGDAQRRVERRMARSMHDPAGQR